MPRIIEQLKYNSFIVYDKYVQRIVLPTDLGDDNKLVTEKYKDFMTFNYNDFHVLTNGVRANSVLQHFKSFVAKKKLLGARCSKEDMEEYFFNKVKRDNDVKYAYADGIISYLSIFDDIVDEKYSPVDINCKSLLYACDNKNVLGRLYLLCNNKEKVETVRYVKLRDMLKDLVKDYTGQIMGYVVTLKGHDICFYGFTGERGAVVTFSLEDLVLIDSVININSKVKEIDYSFSSFILPDDERLLDIG